MPADATRVADIGAGTGKFTRLLRRSGSTVTAIDPSVHMLDELYRSQPEVATQLGTAETIPLETASIDAVSCAQAWHWVDVPRASEEVGRVLRPGGTLGLIWNLRDERVEWVRELGLAMHADGDQFTEDAQAPAVDAPFGESEHARFEWVNPYTRDGILDLVRSRSYFAVMTPDEQRQTLAAVATMLDRYPQTAGRETIDLPYVTVCYRYPRP